MTDITLRTPRTFEQPFEGLDEITDDKLRGALQDVYNDLANILADKVTNAANIATNVTDIATNVTNITTNTTAVAALSHNFIGGLILSNDANPDEDINITAGSAQDSANAQMITLASEITKQIDATWAVGNDAGGLASGASLTASTLYAVWLIRRSDTGVVDVLIDDSFATPDYPTSYDESRLIGAIATDSSSDIITFTQVGDYFRYTGDVIKDVNDTTITNDTFETGTLSVPPLSLAHIYALLSNVTSTDVIGLLMIRTKGAADSVDSSEEFLQSRNTVAFDSAGAIGTVLCNGSSQVEYAANEDSGNVTILINTLGFTMLTRSNP